MKIEFELLPPCTTHGVIFTLSGHFLPGFSNEGYVSNQVVNYAIVDFDVGDEDHGPVKIMVLYPVNVDFREGV